MTHLAQHIGRRSVVSFAACIATLVCIASTASLAEAQITDGLLAYYDFETSTITNVAPNGTAYNVTTSGTPQSGWSGGSVGASDRSTLLAGNALNIVRADNEYINVPIGSGSLASSAGNPNLNGTFTISAWHYLAPDPAALSGRFFVFETTSNNYDLSWGTGTGTGPDGYGAYNAQVYAGGTSLAREQWHHVTHVFCNDGNTINLDWLCQRHARRQHNCGGVRDGLRGHPVW